ncbi:MULTISPECIES: LppA family lipoprotein [Rhodococcus]|uniref:LppA family lipoprotein n=1 Tax=Rhodococcus TaxID=1827 RepID=UPI00163B065C|nr:MULTISPECIES: LppA family lipoprotein [Rhodococcus]MBC2590890.1 hypothetical protein [Rhodococcus aetherivorans]USC17154.1 LppA family lipoprotein [Rhodococcus sp. 11-3]
MKVLRVGVPVLALSLAGCAGGPVPVAVPEPVAADRAGAVEYYTRVQRDAMAALSDAFPEMQFRQSDPATTAYCELPDGSAGTTVFLPIHLSDRPVPPGQLERAARVFEESLAGTGFRGARSLPVETGLQIRMFAADGSSISFGSYLAVTVGLTVGCYPDRP